MRQHTEQSSRFLPLVAEAFEGLEDGDEIGGFGGFLNDGVDAGVGQTPGFPHARGTGPDHQGDLLQLGLLPDPFQEIAAGLVVEPHVAQHRAGHFDSVAHRALEIVRGFIDTRHPVQGGRNFRLLHSVFQQKKIVVAVVHKQKMLHQRNLQ